VQKKKKYQCVNWVAFIITLKSTQISAHTCIYISVSFRLIDRQRQWRVSQRESTGDKEA